MFFEIMRLLAEAREREPEKVPKVLVAENVKALRKLLPVLEAVSFRGHFPYGTAVGTFQLYTRLFSGYA